MEMLMMLHGANKYNEGNLDFIQKAQPEEARDVLLSIRRQILIALR